MESKKILIIVEICAVLIGIYVDIYHTNIVFNRNDYEAHDPVVQVDGKCEDAIDYYKRHKMAKSEEDRDIIENLVAIEYANFDTDNLEKGAVKDFIYRCKNNPD